MFVFFFKQKTAYEMRISDWSSDVCSSDLHRPRQTHRQHIIDQGNVQRRAHTPGVEVADLALDRSLKHTQFGAPRNDIDDAAGRVASIKRALRPAQHLDPFDVQIFLLEQRSEEHTSELQSLMRSSNAVFCLKKKK